MKYVLLLTAWMALRAAASIDEAVSVRLIVNQGKVLQLGASCTRPELERIQLTLLESIKKEDSQNENTLMTSSLRGKSMIQSLDNSFCWEYCAGASPGTCWLVDARCTDIRRNWQRAKQFRSDIGMSSNMWLDDDSYEIGSCSLDKMAIQNAMQTTLLTSGLILTNSCKNMLLQHIDMKCVKVPWNADQSQSQ